jgi:hypothetical protein
LSIGLENVDDLITDLVAAFDALPISEDVASSTELGELHAAH